MAMVGLRPRALAERLRQSLFAIPGLCLLVGAAAGELIVRLDRAGAADWLPDRYETSTANARAVLAAIATGTITVVTLVLTLTLVAIQLAAGQLSPRTIVNFLGDRFQQATVGVVLGTATFSLLALRALDMGMGDEARTPDLTVLVAVAATIGSLVMLVMSVDRTANRLAVGTLVGDLAEETCQLIDRRYGRRAAGPANRTGEPESPPTTTAGTATCVVESLQAGWIQAIDDTALVERVPEGATVELAHSVGSFVLTGMRLATIDADLSDSERDQIRRAIVIGGQRTMQQDVAFGLTRLTDIGLRALSPGVNDPNTAREVVLRLAQVVLTLQAHDLEPSLVEVDNRRIIRRSAPSHDSFVREAFDQLRRAAADDVSTLQTLAATLEVLEHETERRGLPGNTTELRAQHNLARERLSEISDRRGTSEWRGGLPSLP